MNAQPVLSNLAAAIGFSTVALPASTAFVQLPSIPCDEIELGIVTNAISVAGSATPAGAQLNLPATPAGVTRIATGGNAGNLFIANTTATSAQTVGFKWNFFARDDIATSRHPNID